MVTDRFPKKTKKGRIDICFISEIKKVREDQNYLTLIHQIRNSIMIMTFLASTNIILLGLLIDFGNIGELAKKSLGQLPKSTVTNWFLLFALGYTFLNLLLALRHINNFNMLLKSDEKALVNIENSNSADYLGSLFKKSSHRFMMGRRGFLYSLVILSLHINEWIFIAATVALTATLSYQHDF